MQMSKRLISSTTLQIWNKGHKSFEPGKNLFEPSGKAYLFREMVSTKRIKGEDT